MTCVPSFDSPSTLSLTANGPIVPPTIDEWCIENNNMWRSNTDVLQVGRAADVSVTCR